MERDDVWLERAEELLFNAEAQTHNEHFLPLLDTDLYLCAFVHIHRRHNPLIPQWTLACSASNFVPIVTAQWDLQAATCQNQQDINEKRAMVIGAARRLCSLSLKMDQESPHNENYISTAQRRGLLYPVWVDPPSLHAYVVSRYDGTNAAARLEGAEVLSILAHLFATLGVEVPDFTGIPLHRYHPYERTAPPAIGKFISPERRLCASLAYTAFNIRAGKAKGDKRGVRLPFGLLGEQSDASITTFMKEDFKQCTQVNDAKNPLQVAMSTIAGKLCEFQDLGNNVSYLPWR
jgi:hypothetical protein